MLYLRTIVAKEKYVCTETSPPPELKEACVNDVFNSGLAYCFYCYSDEENRDSHMRSSCILVSEKKKKSLISLNNGANKIHRNNRSWGRNYILCVLCPYTVWYGMMLLRESCGIQATVYITATMLSFLQILPQSQVRSPHSSFFFLSNSK